MLEIERARYGMGTCKMYVKNMSVLTMCGKLQPLRDVPNMVKG